ncbi:MAG TPA: hypothetical protein P5560_07265 [Thermotogota bacterium]|nr:hypothetical protein [Thermotogota bacterium]HRW92723.1 hypothetical protein [Thermotogota bacterium]
MGDFSVQKVSNSPVFHPAQSQPAAHPQRENPTHSPVSPEKGTALARQETPRSVSDVLRMVHEGKDLERFAGNPVVKLAKRNGVVPCQTCASRRYQDASTDTGVSFKNGGHISPDSAFAVVSAHEQEHVQKAHQRAQEGQGKVVSASVRIFVDTCPECGRVYVSGGETTTRISSSPEKSYQNDPFAAVYRTDPSFAPSEGISLDTRV